MRLDETLRRAYRALDGIPIVGTDMRKLADRSLRPVYLGCHARVTLLRKRYGRGVYGAVWRNTRSGYERFYGDAELLDEYMTPERIGFYDAVAEVCAALRPSSVIDVGCGTGHLLAAISDRLRGGIELVGVDFAASGIARLAELLPEAEGVVADIATLDLGERAFDLVVCTEVLEHLREPDHAVRVLDLLRRPGRGVIVITVPDGVHDTYEGHVNFWTDATLEALLAPFGVVEIGRVGPSDDLLAVVR